MLEEKHEAGRALAALRPGQLYRECSPDSLPFETTAELPDLSSIIGQPRAQRALTFGSEVCGKGFNIFVMGLPSSGRTTLSRDFLEKKAAELPVPDDLCYVNNFDSPHQPKVLAVPAGRARVLRQDIRNLVSRSILELDKAFQSDVYQKERNRLKEALNKKQEAALNRLKAFAAKYNFLIARTPIGYMLVPAVEGQPISPEEIEKLPPEKIETYKKLEDKIGVEVKKTLEKLREMERDTNAEIEELDRRTAFFIIEPVVDELRTRYESLPQICEYLEEVVTDIASNVNMLQEEDGPGGPNGMTRQKRWLARYDINVLVDHTDLLGAPVIIETQPTYQNLLGRIEHEVVMGASRTDFTLIRAGALHRANGGYLVLPLRDLLMNPYAYDGLKRSLRDDTIRIIELGNQLGLISTSTLEPEPIALNVRVVLIGTPMLYYLMRMYDEDFPKLFKVRAEFASEMDRTAEAEKEYALFIRSVAKENQLKPFDRTAIARIIEEGSRMVSDQNKLSTRFGKIADLAREAAYWADKNGGNAVAAADVERAIDETIYRSSLLEERIQENIESGVLLIDVAGRAVGQINALSVIMLGDYAFGRPSRVSAAVSMGRGSVVDIERKSEMSGALHTKGVLILNGFLAGRYGRRQPLSLTASLTFEQSYEGVDGDSASAAELVALLSALTEVPIRQDIAVTGSINQHGQIQPIGGVNEKIEGFFAVCKQRGLSGRQGVVIPASNARHLMLRREVVSAVAAGEFHIWTAETIDQVLGIFSGMEAGEPDAHGFYPEGTFHARVEEKLEEFAKVLKEFGGPGVRTNGHEPAPADMDQRR